YPDGSCRLLPITSPRPLGSRRRGLDHSLHASVHVVERRQRLGQRWLARNPGGLGHVGAESADDGGEDCGRGGHSAPPSTRATWASESWERSASARATANSAACSKVQLVRLHPHIGFA